jgi:hypothetical protein
MLKRPLKLWHAVLAVVLIAALGAAGTAIALGGKRTPTLATGQAGGYSYVISDLINNPAHHESGGNVRCPQGTFVLGGGASNNSTHQVISDSHPGLQAQADFPPHQGWFVVMNNIGDTDQTFQVWAVCGPKFPH